MNRLVAGSISGLGATFPMTAVMAGFHAVLRRDEQHPLPPRHITHRLAKKAGAAPGFWSDKIWFATLVSHFGYGASMGALYGAIVSKRAQRAPLTHGIGYGLSVWAVSYLGLLPALKILPSATKESAGRNVLMIGAHVVWGAALGMFCRSRDNLR